MNRYIVMGCVAAMVLSCGRNEKKGDGKEVRHLRSELGKKDREIDEERQKRADEMKKLEDELKRAKSATEELARKEAELAALHQELVRTNGELTARGKALEEKMKELAALRQEIQKKDQEIATLRASQKTLEARVTELEASLAEQKKLVTEKETELVELREKVRKLNEELAAIRLNGGADDSRRVVELSAELEAKKKELEEQNAQLTTLREEMTKKDEEIAALRKASEEVENRVKDKMDELNRLVANVTEPMAGLWYFQLEKQTFNGDPCTLFVHLEGTRYQKAVICGKEEEEENGIIHASYESGSFDRFELHHTEVGEIDFHRRVLVKPSVASCTDDGFMKTTKSLAWTAGAANFLAIDTSAGEFDGLSQDRNSNSSRTCAEILANPSRVGLEKAVFACRTFALSETDVANVEQIGCFKGDGALEWQRQAPVAVSTPAQ